MEASLVIAQALGMYLIIMGFAILLHREDFISILTGIFHNAALQFMIGVIALIIGILMVVMHNVWESSWTVVITILAWLTLAKGICYVMLPKAMNRMGHAIIQNKNWIYIMAVVNLVLGFYLSYMGFLS